MSREFVCRCGHRWQTAEARDTQNLRCPACDGAPFLYADTPAAPSFVVREAMDFRPPPLPRIAGFEILDELGRGGMGVVYKARQVSLNRLVALKMLLAGPEAGADLLARFRTEAEAAARLQHPNVVQVFEVGQTEGRPYVVLEYIPGQTLSARLGRTPQPPRLAAALVRILARAVQHAHEQGILHRDLKPTNVLLQGARQEEITKAPSKQDSSSIFDLLSSFGTPKIADFGLAKILAPPGTPEPDGPTPTGAVLGTPSYMAPEQASGAATGSQIGPAADVWALGATLYEILSGRPPFLGATSIETILQVVHDDPVPPTRLQPACPRDLETVCLKCLHKDPSRRYGTARDLAEDLGRFLEGLPVRARRAGRAERLTKWARRRPAQAVLAAMCLLALGGAIAATAWHQHRMRQANEALADALARKESERKRSVEVLRTALRTLEEYGSLIDDRLAPVPHLEAARQELLERRLRFCEPLAQLEPEDPEVRQALGLAHLSAGLARQRLGRLDEAQKDYRKACQRFAERVASDPSPEGRKDLANALIQSGMLLAARGHEEEGASCLARGQAMLQELVAAGTHSLDARRSLAAAYHNHALFKARSGKVDEARSLYEQAISLKETLAQEFPSDDRYPYELALSLHNLGTLEIRLGKPQQAQEAFARTRVLLRRLAPHHPEDVDQRRLAAATAFNLGILRYDHRPADALLDYGEACVLWSQLHEDFPRVPEFTRQTAHAYFNRGLLLKQIQRLPQAAEDLSRSLALGRELTAAVPPLPGAQADLCPTLYHLADVRLRLGVPQEAGPLWREEIALLREGLHQGPEPKRHEALAMALGQLGDLHRDAGLRCRSLPPAPAGALLDLTFGLQQLSSVAAWQAHLGAAAACYREALAYLHPADVRSQGRRMPTEIINWQSDRLADVATRLGDEASLLLAASDLAEVAAARRASLPEQAAALYRQAAGCAARCVCLLQADATRSPTQTAQQREARGRQAVEWLRQAIAAGYHDRHELESAAELAPLRSRADFGKLLEELGDW